MDVPGGLRKLHGRSMSFSGIQRRSKGVPWDLMSVPCGLKGIPGVIIGFQERFGGFQKDSGVFWKSLGRFRGAPRYSRGAPWGFREFERTTVTFVEFLVRSRGAPLCSGTFEGVPGAISLISRNA